MKEVEAGRHAGPFTEIPFENYIQSPIGLVPKAGNKTWLIFHLSYDFDENRQSVNYHTPKEWCTVKYNDLDYAIKTCLNLIGAPVQRSSPAQSPVVKQGKIQSGTVPPTTADGNCQSHIVCNIYGKE